MIMSNHWIILVSWELRLKNHILFIFSLCSKTIGYWTLISHLLCSWLLGHYCVPGSAIFWFSIQKHNCFSRKDSVAKVLNIYFSVCSSLRLRFTVHGFLVNTFTYWELITFTQFLLHREWIPSDHFIHAKKFLRTKL